MTDEIIIDGVDVSGCKHYKNQNCLADYLLTNKEFSEAKCIASPNCYYKQLARKTEECEKLKYWLNKIRDEELSSLDIEFDEYETSSRLVNYSNIITYVEIALGEIDE